jgi:cytochrome c-type biogenesis protein CcmE
MEQTSTSRISSGGRGKFFIGISLLVAAIIYLIVSSTQANAQYFLTGDELLNKGNAAQNQDVRISGSVVGDSIEYDPASLTLTFLIAHIPGDNDEIEAQGGLGAVLHDAVMDSSRHRLLVQYSGPKPDLLRNEAQAIITGRMSPDGVFLADELLLKCPTKYEDAIPEQTE